MLSIFGFLFALGVFLMLNKIYIKDREERYFLYKARENKGKTLINIRDIEAKVHIVNKNKIISIEKNTILLEENKQIEIDEKEYDYLKCLFS